MIAIGGIAWWLFAANLYGSGCEFTTGLSWSGMKIVIAGDNREKSERGK